jgi:crotonobetainyl-CoA:carnitine CoA-transferase CaiB-like acyl-CoA transferase
MAVFTDEEWQGLCRVTGNPEWTRDVNFTSLKSRKENEDELERLIEEWTVNYTAEEVMTRLQNSGVATGVAQTSEDLMEHDPQMKERHFYYELDHSEVGVYRSPRPPYLMSKLEFDMQRAPLLGEDNEYVLNEILGMIDDEITELVIEGVLE